MRLAGSANSDWYLGLTLGFVIVTVVVIVVAVILTYASRISDQAALANEGLEEVRTGTAPLWEVRKTNVAGVAILGAARTAREVVVATLTGAAATPPEPPPFAAPAPEPAAPSSQPVPASPPEPAAPSPQPAAMTPAEQPPAPSSSPPPAPPGVLGRDSYPYRGKGA